MRHKKLILLTICLVHTLNSGILAQERDQRPNFLIILGDDISANSLGCYGSENPNTSPHIDQLAAEGIRFSNMFVSEAMCAPVRAELYTGLQPQRNGCFRNHMGTNEGTLSVVHYLEKLGYRVGLAGKRHFRPASVYPFEFIEGFEPMCTSRAHITENWEGVKEFITRDPKQPFCLFICSIHAHAPWDAGDASQWNTGDLFLPGHFADNETTRKLFRDHLAEVKVFDEQVGKARVTLKEMNLEDNTALIVLDENGAGMPCGKWTTFDWGTRSACIMKWPESYGANFVSDALAQYCDILPTLIDAAHGEVPEGLDGRSLLPLIEGKTDRHRDKAYFVFNNRDDRKVNPLYSERAVTDGRFKLIWNLTPGNLFAINPTNGFDFGHRIGPQHSTQMFRSWVEQSAYDPRAEKMVQRYRNRPEYQLFDLDADPWELDNLADNPAYKSTLEELKTSINEWMARQGDEGHLHREFHVAKHGSDENTGTEENPFLTIQRAANLAQPGNVITVHEGIYRERVNLLRGGTADRPIIYQAAPGEKVEIKGSELIKGWKKEKGDVWKVVLPNSFFGAFNPYSDTIHGHWFDGKGRTHHTGSVYLNGNWMGEAVSLEEVIESQGNELQWIGKVDRENTTIWAQFPDCNPNEEEVEINVRQTVFFPEKQGVNYITVRGFHLSQAATSWAPPTTKQIGLIGPHWSKGWIIEDNVISHSICVGICLGLGDVGKSVIGNGIGYTELANFVSGNKLWSKEKIGSHVVRNNRISHCEQAGIVGSFGAAFSLIEGNEISDIHIREQFTGMEQGGIKLHAAVDVVIRNNCVYNTGLRARGIWLDWMGQGGIISENMVFNTKAPALYLEVNHGPILVANNILLSETALSNRSRGTAFVHNYFGGQCVIGNTTRITPFMEPHSTAIKGMHENYNGDDRFYNNIFAAPAKDGKSVLNEEDRRIHKPGKLAFYDDESMPLYMHGNLYLNGAIPHKKDSNPLIINKQVPEIKIIRKTDGLYLSWQADPKRTKRQKRELITTEMLGRALVPDMAYEHADGTPLRIDTDYLNHARKPSNPEPGPFILLNKDQQNIRVWPKPLPNK